MKSYIWKGFVLGSQMAVVTQKTSEVVSALAQRQDVLEIELQELQQVLLAMQVNTFFLIISLSFWVPTYPSTCCTEIGHSITKVQCFGPVLI
jgi:hypothetical protein